MFRLSCMLTNYFDLLQMGLFLHPRFKTLAGLTDIEKVMCMDHISVELSVQDDTHERIPQPQAKKARVQSKFYEFEETTVIQEEDLCASEINKYQGLAYDPNLSVLDFWRHHERDLLKLARLARNILCITPSSAPSERAFSLAGHVLSSRWTSLKHGSVNDILMLNSQLKQII